MSNPLLVRCLHCGGQMGKDREQGGICWTCETYGPVRVLLPSWRFAWQTPDRSVYQVDQHGNRIEHKRGK